MTQGEAQGWVEAACSGDATTAEAFKLIRKELNQLRAIAHLCWDEMNHGFDLPSDVFDAVEKYYKPISSGERAGVDRPVMGLDETNGGRHIKDGAGGSAK